MIEVSKTCLIIVDVQNDFCPGGALAVNDGDQVISPLNKAARAVYEKGGRVAATQDWHPAGHVSFASAHAGKKIGDTTDAGRVTGQALWPDHCVSGSEGAAFHQDLDLKPVSLLIRKGFRKGLDSYSAFFENDHTTPTGLYYWLKGLGITTVLLGGLATDYCVFYSAMDSAGCGFRTYLLLDACRAVGFPEGSAERAVQNMTGAGIEISDSETILSEIHSADNFGVYV